jgi:hypothetical protein
MRRTHRRLPSALALALALSALASPIRALGATGAATGASAPAPTFTVPASARVHGSAPTTPPASTVPNGVTTPTTTPAAPSSVATTPAGAASPGATTPAPATVAPASTAPATGAPASTTPVLPAGSAATRAPGAQHATSSTKLSTGAIVAAALAALLILVCLAWGAARWFAYEPRWSISLRHSLAEASWRLSASWDEFSDWARIGR